jgi:negative regulator of replication initiation
MSALREIAIDLEVHRVIESARRSFEESDNDILRRLLLVGAGTGAASPRDSAVVRAGAAGSDAEEVPRPGTRTTGRWAVELLGQRYAVPNLKAAYRKALLLLAARHPDFLTLFAAEGGRARRFIARAPQDLYLASPALATKHSAPLVDGWFFDTNLSADQVSRRVRIAARLCGLHYGSELRLLNNLEQV